MRRHSARSRRSSAGVSASTGSRKLTSSVSTRRIRSIRSSSAAPVALSGDALRFAGRTTSSGCSSRCRRSHSLSAWRQAETSARPSIPVSRWRSMQAAMASCWPSGTAHIACASEGPTVPRSTRACSAGDRLRARRSRRSTQPRLRWQVSAMAATLRPSSVRIDCSTLASSIADTLRGGALLASSICFASAGEHRPSITTGTATAPAARQRRSRLKPSMTSSRPASSRTTRSGISHSAGPLLPSDDAAEDRSFAKLVPSWSGGTSTISGTMPAAVGDGPLPVAARIIGYVSARSCAARSRISRCGSSGDGSVSGSDST